VVDNLEIFFYKIKLARNTWRIWLMYSANHPINQFGVPINFLETLMKITLSILCTALLIISEQVFAEPPHDPAVGARQQRQNQRIKQGSRSGELTRDEARKLREEQRVIRHEERAYKADGKLTREERKDLHQDLNDLSKDIYTEKHDGDKRPKVK